MQDEAVKGVLAEYKDKLKAWYTKFCAEDTPQSDKLGMEQFLRYCNEKGVIGIWTVLQQRRTSTATPTPASSTSSS